MSVSTRKRVFMRWRFCLTALLVSKSVATPFANLDFEQVIPPLIPPYSFDTRVPITNALPGWSGFVGAEPVTLVLTNGMFLDSAGVSLFGPGGPYVYSGNYSAFIQSGFPLYNPTGQITTALSQTGSVPEDAQSIRLAVQTLGTFSVSLGGETLSLTPLLVGPNYTIYGANIPGMAGQTEELRITAVSRIYSPPFPPMASWVWLDSISFSSEVVVPEPRVIALVLCGGLLLALKTLRARRKGFKP
jgi:hypothetical protein